MLHRLAQAYLIVHTDVADVGSLRSDIEKRQAQVVFVDDFGWNLFVDDPLKNGRHRRP